MKQWLLVITFLAVAGLTAACGAGLAQPESAQIESTQTESNQAESTQPQSVDLMLSTQPQSVDLTFDTQSNDEKAVGVEVTPLNLPEGGTSLDFEVAFNTHSVDLSFDPTTISVLRDDAGREYPALVWEGSGPGGHHRSGVLRFKVPDDATDFIEVVIHDVAGVPERVFHWHLTQ